MSKMDYAKVDYANTEMPCPNCGTMIPHGKMMKHQVAGKVIVAPNDQQCECGAHLRVMVPIVKVTAYGWNWKIIHPEQERPLSQVEV